MIRTLLICLLLLAGRLASGQSERFSINFQDESFESVLDLVSSNTGYFFSYNSEITPDGSRFSMSVDKVTIEEFLNKFLLGTGLEHQMLQGQVILRRKPIQENSGAVMFSLSGRVIDSLTNAPIPSANVFLSGTNIGGVSDLDGYYNIDGVPAGTYEVIFSHLSYEMSTQLISRFSPGMKTIDATLKEQLKVLDTLQVLAKRLIGPRERERYIRIFENEFLGRSSISSRCTLLNPEVLDFIYDPDLDKLEVFALEPLRVVNEYLGYEIVYIFQSFQRMGGQVKFYGKARFDNLKPETKKEARQWLRNRKRAYKGSFLHFRRSLIENELRGNDFKISIVESEDLDEIGDAYETDIRRSDILRAVEDSTYVLNFDDFLRVLYRRRPDKSYRNQFYEERAELNSQLSLIRLNDEPVLLRKNGRMEYPGVATYGYWYWERIGDLLPENYNPENDNFEILQ